MKDWRELENGTIEILVKWRGFEETWEPAVELFKDVPEKVLKFLRENEKDNPPLQALKQQLQAPVKTKPKRKGRGRGRGRGRSRGRSRGRGPGGRGRGRGRGRGANRK